MNTKVENCYQFLKKISSELAKSSGSVSFDSSEQYEAKMAAMLIQSNYLEGKVYQTLGGQIVMVRGITFSGELLLEELEDPITTDTE